MDELFHVSERKSTIGTELRAGLTTFLAMAYIIAVNPAVLSGAGIDAGALACATCLGAGIMTICMGIFANRPLACASGLGVNAMIAGIATTVCGGDWHVAMSVIFLEGIVILLLVLCGLREAIMDAIRQLLLMLLLGIVLVYLVMVAQFQSLRSPLIVMFTIPLAFTGGFLALLLAGVEVSVISLIGFVMLVGVIVNNGIVLVDYINQLRLEGMGRREAIIEAGVTRLRPILMTSLTTILGLIVMAFGNNVGTALMQPVALVCIGGLLYATLMTLLVVPCMYDILSRRDLRKVDEEELKLLDM